MGKRNKAERYKPQAFESAKGGNDHFTRVFESMLTHEAFKKLSSSARSVYLILKAQYRGETYSSDSTVICPYWVFNEYGIQNRTASRALQELETAGFIKIKRGTKQTEKSENLHRHPNEYKFVAKWYKGEEEEKEKGEV